MAGGFALALHGGAGTLVALQDDGRARGGWVGLWRALGASRDVLAAAGNAVEAMTSAACALDDDL